MAAACACGSPSGSAPAPSYGALGAGEVARVGSVSVGAPLVAAVAESRGTDARTAAGSLVQDALAAEGARAERLDSTPELAWASTVALARRVPIALAREAHAAGPPTDDELATLSVVHAVVLRTHSLEPSRGLAIAGAIAEAVAGARDADDFEARAAAVSRQVRTSIERLPPFDATGRMTDGNQVDADFVAGAFALRAAGDTSPVVETSFGWHVIRLVGRALPTGADLEARRVEVTPMVDALRARILLASTIRARRDTTRIEVSAAAAELLSRMEPSP